MWHPTPLLKHPENRKNLPATLLNLQPLSLMEHARNILVESTSRYMTDPMHVAGADNLKHLLYIYLRRCKKDIAKEPPAEFRDCIRVGQSRIGDNLAHQAEPVGMNSAGCNPDKHVSDLHL